MATATFAGGCFWCVEAAFKVVPGVSDVTSGYAGGDVEDPTYREVCTGRTGHAEAVQMEYDEEAVSYRELLELFFRIHNPERDDGQGPDTGSQYRPVIFYHDEEQRSQAVAYIQQLEEADAYDEIKTAVEPLDTFYEAEEEHQDYFEKHPNDAYCQMHARPKVEKVQESFEED